MVKHQTRCIENVSKIMKWHPVMYKGKNITKEYILYITYKVKTNKQTKNQQQRNKKRNIVVVDLHVYKIDFFLQFYYLKVKDAWLDISE